MAVVSDRLAYSCGQKNIVILNAYSLSMPLAQATKQKRDIDDATL